jgi:hypothetical protein
MVDTYKQVNETLTEKATKDADEIERLAKEVRKLKMILEQEQTRNEAKLQIVYDRMFSKVMEASKDFSNYKRVTELEHSVKENIIEKQALRLQQMYAELRATKTMLEVPKFRTELPKYDFKGMTFREFTETFGKIYHDIQ